MTTQDTVQNASGASMTQEEVARFNAIHKNIMDGFERDSNTLADMFKAVAEYVVPSIEKIDVTPEFRVDVLSSISIIWSKGKRIVHANVSKDNDGVFEISVLYSEVKDVRNRCVDSEESHTLATYTFDRIAEFLNG